MLTLITLTVVAATYVAVLTDLCLEAAAWDRACREARATLADRRKALALRPGGDLAGQMNLFEEKGQETR